MSKKQKKEEKKHKMSTSDTSIGIEDSTRSTATCTNCSSTCTCSKCSSACKCNSTCKCSSTCNCSSTCACSNHSSALTCSMTSGTESSIVPPLEKLPPITTSLTLTPTTNGGQSDAVIIKIKTYAPSSGVAGPVQSIPDDFCHSLQTNLKLNIAQPILLIVTSSNDKCVYFYGDTFQQVIEVEISTQAGEGVYEVDVQKIFQHGLNALLPNYCIFLKADIRDDSSSKGCNNSHKIDVLLPHPRSSKIFDSYLHIDVNHF